MSLLTSITLCYGQISVRMPLEVSEAFRNGTRTISGKPGTNYWQNYSDYKIDAVLDTKESRLRGSEIVNYYNLSPDTLSIIVIRLYPDFYKKGNSRSWTIGDEDLTDGMKLNKIHVNGQKYSEDKGGNAHRENTNLIIHLNNQILPGNTAILEIDWEMEIPKKRWARMGNYGNDRIFVAYWYPQIAVYDDIDSWDRIPYLGTVEFYNDFNNFDVTIETPHGFTVWATGELTNINDLYTKNVIARYNEALSSNEIIKVFTVDDCKNGKVLKSKGKNKWNFAASEVPDFTFAATKSSNWDATSTIADHNTGHRVLVDAVYPDSVDTFHEAALIAQKSVQFMVDSLPGYPFPWPHITSFCNGNKYGGMESPMMVNESDPTNRASAIGLIFHEILHSYFPFSMGCNERKYAWMDEGWAAWLPYGILNEISPDYNYFERVAGSFAAMSGKEREVPLMYPSNFITDYSAYRVHSYNRSAVAYSYLREALGDSVFKCALHSYMDRWSGKHPIPYDFFNTFENVSNQDIDWFFIPWFFNRDMADLGIKKVTNDNKIVVENTGGLPLPVCLNVNYSDGSHDSFYRNITIWRTGQSAVIISADPDKEMNKITLGRNDIPDVISENNEYVFHN